MSNVNPIRKCHLCRRERDLCLSHILSEFLYLDLYDNKHRFLKVTSDPSDLGNAFPQKGFREHLLCDECENKISKWESYGKNVLDEVKRLHAFHGVVYMQKVDYTMFKLFLMSLLWRISISTIFNDVKLEKVNEEQLRQMVYRGDAGRDLDFPCVLRKLRKRGNHPYDTSRFFRPPVQMSIQSVVDCHFVIYGFAFDFIIGQYRKIKAFSGRFLSNTGNLLVYVVDDTFIVDYWRQTAIHAIRGNRKFEKMWIDQFKNPRVNIS